MEEICNGTHELISPKPEQTYVLKINYSCIYRNTSKKKAGQCCIHTHSPIILTMYEYETYCVVCGMLG